jgi:hypothetical protein
MKIVQYHPQLFGDLRKTMAKKNPASSLNHENFVNYYYANNDWCKLYLIMDNQELLGTIGVDSMLFKKGLEEISFGMASNFNSFKSGIGGLLFLKWMKSCGYGIIFGGSEETHRIIRAHGWSYFEGVRVYLLNKTYQDSSREIFWRIAAKKILFRLRQKKISRYFNKIPKACIDNLVVTEEDVFSENLIPRMSPFSFRFSPRIDYLDWRYNTKLPFVRYRIFRILRNARTSGYVVINDGPKRILIAQCDGDNPKTLAYGALLSLIEVSRKDEKPREVLLTSSHREMQKIFQLFGFRAERSRRFFAIGTSRSAFKIEPDTSDWLVNFDWTDNGLRRPFLDEL